MKHMDISIENNNKKKEKKQESGRRDPAFIIIFNFGSGWFIDVLWIDSAVKLLHQFAILFEDS